jgi:membrane-associated protease RseP (regulator of RpoE activity)
MSSNSRLCAFALLVLLAGCASVTRAPYEPELSVPAPGSPYVPEPGRDAATIAAMRAAPAPALPELSSGHNPNGDQSSLAAQGFVRIGSARYRLDEGAAKEQALHEGQRAGADRVLLYAPAAGGNATAGEWLAVYFVRFRLPFGATFRDLQPAERATLGGGGVEIGSVVGGTPASRANLIAGDYVTALDGKPVADRADFQDRLKRSAGHSVTLTVVRNGESLQRVVRLGEWSANGRN